LVPFAQLKLARSNANCFVYVHLLEKTSLGIQKSLRAFESVRVFMSARLRSCVAEHAAVIPRVLSIQSHVVHGCVGNRAATFPLQLLGFEVDPINTVHLSNHTGYAVFKGTRLTASEFDDIVVGLEKNDFLPKYSHILTGYIGSASVLRSALSVVDKVRAATSGRAAYVCDPVLGDNGRLYCPEDMVAVCRHEAVPRADLLTPNCFEASVLSGVDVVDVPSALRACTVLHRLGAGAVVVKSINVGERVLLVGSDAASGDRFELCVGDRTRYLSGLGDLTAALLLAHGSRAPSLRAAVVAATASVQAVLRRTLDAGSGELALTMCAAAITAPPGIDLLEPVSLEAPEQE
jgi:pyridoxine kinase